MPQAKSHPIHVTEPRTDVHIQLESGLTLSGAIGTPLQSFLEVDRQHHPERYPTEIIGGVLNGRLRELGYPLKADGKLTPVLMSSSDGNRIYRRSLVLLMSAAAQEIFPAVKVSVRYAVYEGGFYCTLQNRHPFSADELVQLQTHMRQMVAEALPIVKQLLPIEEAVSMFKARGADDKLRLLEQRERQELVVYQLRDHVDYHYGYMLPTTGFMKFFQLVHMDEGFVLQYPRAGYEGREMPPINPHSKLKKVFQQADEWLSLMGVEDIGRLNSIVRRNRTQELILVAEALHEQRIANIAGKIQRRHQSGSVRTVLIAGPSSSGKTTFAKRLAIQLLAHGVVPFTLELDNYFVDREHTPRDENGDYDFETLEAVDVALFNEHLLALMRGERVQLPRFNFKTGKREVGREAQVAVNNVIIIEGIHGLNPNLVPDIPDDNIYRVYVSALTQLNVDTSNRVPTTDVRLLRRIVRDALHRGWSAQDTLQRWTSVRRGEKRNIFPYQENADSMFNSALVYELAALRPLAEPLLLQVEGETSPHIEANRLLSFLRWVQPLTPEQREAIPDTSLLREFIGGSSLDHYHSSRLDN